MSERVLERAEPIEVIRAEDLPAAASRAVAAGWRFASLVADQPRPPGLRLDYVFCAPRTRQPVVLRVDSPGADAEVPSIALTCPAPSSPARRIRGRSSTTRTGRPVSTRCATAPRSRRRSTAPTAATRTTTSRARA
jgi:hypothetical protein